MAECELLDSCGFFRKYMNSHEAACKGLIAMYCRGPKQAGCKRKEYRTKHGKPPVDEMLPNGAMFKP
ncbi:hypothetical protein JCM14469_10540 [Desulfatiferula olefinivorans]